MLRFWKNWVSNVVKEENEEKLTTPFANIPKET